MKAVYFFVILFEIAQVVQASELPSPDLPAGIETQWITKKMEMNGLPMNISSFKTNLSDKELSAAIKKYLSSVGGAVHQFVDEDGWLTYGTKGEDVFYSIKTIKHGMNVEGVITISGLENKDPELDRPLPMNVVRVEKQKYYDGSVIQEFEVFAFSLDISESRVVLEKMMLKNGWRTTRTYTGNRLEFIRSNGRAEALFQKNQDGMGTLLLVSKEYGQ